MHHREDLYPRAAEFLPERWEGQKPGTYTWLPFGGGTRRCLGAALAMAELRVAIPAIARRFDLMPDRPEAEAPLHRNVTMIPQRGGRVVVVGRAEAPGWPRGGRRALEARASAAVRGDRVRHVVLQSTILPPSAADLATFRESSAHLMRVCGDVDPEEVEDERLVELQDLVGGHPDQFLGGHRRRSGADRAAVTVEADLRHLAVVVDAQRDAELVTARRVLVVRLEVGGIQHLPVPRPLVVLEDVLSR